MEVPMKHCSAVLLVCCCLGGFETERVFAQPPPAAKNSVVSEYVNERLPDWLNIGGELRSRLEAFSGGGFRPENDDLYMLTRVRLNLGIKPTGWMKFQFQAQDAQVFGKNTSPDAPPFEDTFDLRMAYVEFGDSEKKPVGLRVGRQELVFGEQRLIGHVSWLNTARSFDAVRATFRHKGYRLDAFASSVVNIREGEFNKRVDGNNFHGLYGGIEKSVPQAVIEPYLLWRLAPRLRLELGSLGNLDHKTIGFRWAGKLPAAFDYSIEMANQRGSLGTDQVGTWAGHWLLGRTIDRLPYKPRFILEYNYASGDKNPRDGVIETFDQLYPTPHDKTGLSDQIGWRNILHLRSGIELKPAPKWLLSSSYHSFWLADRHDGLYGVNSALIVRVPDGSAGRFVGQELDVQALWNTSKTIQIAGGYAYLFPGTFLKNTTPGSAYGFPFVSVNYLF
jgi:hypothetical protein